jgi:glyoxylase-like metal-dependent hydrolase (beta-lactamase superfamily II)/rhodanese-related sulfurtransferase
MGPASHRSASSSFGASVHTFGTPTNLRRIFSLYTAAGGGCGAEDVENSLVGITAFVDEGLGNSSYLVDIGDRRALVIDPARETRPYRELANATGAALAYAVETHLHADFVSGSRELAAVGATIVAPRAADLAFAYAPLGDRESIDLGGLRLEAIGTPGHTPEHLGYLLVDGPRPVALFSGGALLPGAVARTDLIAPDQTEGLARSLYRALHERILSLPDDLPVYPTHGAGSFCSTGSDGERTTTIGRERASNPLLAAPDEDGFVAMLLGTLGTYPTYFGRLREVNRLGPRVYGAFPPLARLSVDEVERGVRGGAELMDVRPIEAFAAGHVPGSLSIALRPSFASWLGWLVPADRPLTFVLGPDQDRAELVRQALGIGYEKLAGELDGGIEAWRDAGRLLARTNLVRALDPEQGAIVDVRQDAEYTAGHVPDASSVELGSLVGPALAGLPGRATFMCGHGERAMSAASIAERSGREAAVYVGGPDRWARQVGRPLARG